MKPLRERPPLESTVEQYLIDQVRALGGKTIKLAGAEAGTPDRLVALWDEAFLIEVKRPGAKLRQLQRARAIEWSEDGISVYYVDSREAVDEILEKRAESAEER